LANEIDEIYDQYAHKNKAAVRKVLEEVPFPVLEADTIKRILKKDGELLISMKTIIGDLYFWDGGEFVGSNLIKDELVHFPGESQTHKQTNIYT